MKQFSATLIPVLMALSMSSCSRLDLGVRWADWAIMREVNSYFDLNSKQDAELRKKVQADLLEVRRKTFPEIANLFRQVAEKLEADQVTPEQIQEWHQVGLGLFQSVLQHFRQTALDFSLALEEKQLFYFQKSFTEKTS